MQTSVAQQTDSNKQQSLALGIDTGGTFTDAVIVRRHDEHVVAAAKAPTTYHDLSIGIAQAISAVVAALPAPHRVDGIEMIGLSTTLATNAIVEGSGGRVCLILIGYDRTIIENYQLAAGFATKDFVYVAGGHDEQGAEVCALDEAAVCAAVRERLGQVDAFAVSGYFGVRNPAHELRAKALIVEQQAADPVPVTCGHELTTKLDSVRRAMTTVLNARLIPQLSQLIRTVGTTAATLGVRAPVMVVKGDGSLVRAEWAMQRPIETILSGPAASVVGAFHMVGRPDMWVVDVGGTTTDIALLEQGLPRLNPEGAVVGRWRTMVEAIDTRSIGLGGDSGIRFIQERTDAALPYHIGPRRTIPLCVLAAAHPQVTAELQRQSDQRDVGRHTGRFVTVRSGDARGLSADDLALVAAVTAGPLSFEQLQRDPRFMYSLDFQIERLVARGVVAEAAFTPTDALHVLGQFDRWDPAAARLGAALLARCTKMAPEAFAQAVVAEVSARICQEVVSKIRDDSAVGPGYARTKRSPAAADDLMDLALGRRVLAQLAVELRLAQPLVGIGAPVWAFMPQAAALLHTESIIVEHSAVANAVGAVVGGIVQRAHVNIRSVETVSGEIVRFFLPESSLDFDSLDEGVPAVRAIMEPWIEQQARAAGAEHIHVEMTRHDTRASSTGGHDDIYLGTDLVFTATGRPAAVRAVTSPE